MTARQEIPGLPPDQEARDLALDPAGSFIVQAPAGSGKTGLLIQRYLTLLATVENPEEVVAVTFTRKAAREMRGRVLAALADVGAADLALGPRDGGTGGEDSHPGRHFERRTRALAKKAMARDTARGWEILSSPSRLRILTIDALCASIIRQSPWRGRLGGDPRIVEDAGLLYRQAVRELMEILDVQDPPEAAKDSHRRAGRWSDALARVLTFLDNDLTRFESTLVRMLERRDQWLRHLVRDPGPEDTARDDTGRNETGPGIRQDPMLRAIEGIVTDALARLGASVPAGLRDTLVAVAGYAGENLATADPASPIAGLAGLDAMPGNGPGEIARWRGMTDLLLTQGGTWRSRHTRKEGFPSARDAGAGAAKAGEMKKMAGALMEDLAGNHDFRVRLHAVRELPDGTWDNGQWAVLDALVTVLRLAAASLRMVFARHGMVDFIEVAHGALAALGDDEAPSELALSLDYRIRHLLVDEFQDTSHTQVRLFSGLMAGWQPGDGRTLFLVGDPMQSIYRFREADVGLYLGAREFGIGGIPLESLVLSANFRSEPPIVQWIDQTFPLVFPATDDRDAGAVRFSPSVPGRALETSGDSGDGEEAVLREQPKKGDCHLRCKEPFLPVLIRPYRQDRKEQEAWDVVALIRAAREEDPDGTIAVIVRGRNHLDAILPCLDAARIPYRGVDLAPLIHRPAVRDLLALTRALLHPGDRIAWLSVLRAPWCGLTLHDLHALVSDDLEAPILERLRAVATGEGIHRKGRGREHLQHMSPEGRARAGRVFPVLDHAIRNRGRRPLRTVLEGVWMTLGGEACITAGEVPDVAGFLGLLEEIGAEGGPIDGQRVTEKVSRLYATPNPDESRVEIMTIHKAKGLEFDTVIVPGLGRPVRPPEKPLLAWSERPTADGGFDLILAPMPGPGGATDPIYAYLCAMEETRTRHEAARLLYVAATRARKRLCLLGQVAVSEKTGEVRPGRQSLLSYLWPVVSSVFTEPGALDPAPDEGAKDGAVDDAGDDRRTEAAPRVGTLWRLPANWLPLEPPAPVPWPDGQPPEAPSGVTEPIEFLWAGHVARSVGTIIHRVLRELAEYGYRGMEAKRPGGTWNSRREGPLWRAQLRAFGVPEAELGAAVARIARAIEGVLEDPRWEWILDPGHTHARNEYPLTGVVAGHLADGVIDRTFVDKAGVRWIIDYKTGTHEGGDLPAFLDQEEIRYRAQMERYGHLLAHGERRATWAGLYFPLLKGWRAWEVMPGMGSGL